MKNPFNWNLRFGTIPSEFKEAMTYEEQIMWLYSQIKELKSGDANYNYDLLENKPSIDGVILQGNITKSQLGIEQNYNILTNKPQINGLTLMGNRSLNDLGIQAKLIPGTGISISGNTISATGGGGSSSSYLDLTNKPSINDVELIGDKRAFQLGLQDLLQIDYNSKIQNSKYYDMTNIQIGDTLTLPIVLENNSNYKSIIIQREKGMHFEITGNYELLTTNENYEVTTIFSTEGEENGYIDITGNEGVLIINFSALNEINLTLTYTAEYIKNLAKYNKKLTQNIVLGTSILNLETGFYNTDKFKLYLTEAIDEEIICGNYETFYFDNDSQTLITSFEHFKFNTSLNQWTYYYNHYIGDGVLSDNHYMIPTSHAVYQAIRNISPSGSSFYTELSSNVLFKADGTTEPELSSGYYYNTNYTISFYNDGDYHSDAKFKNAIFYYDATNKKVMLTFNNNANKKFIYIYEFVDSPVNEWLNNKDIDENSFLKSSDLFYTNINENITLNADGTITPSLTQGYYHLNKNKHITYYKQDSSTETIYDFSDGIFYYDSSANSLILIINETNYHLDYRITHLSTYWSPSILNNTEIIRNLTGSYSRLATSIPSSGENNFVPNNEAVRNYIASKITYGTTDIVAGTSPLNEGSIYLVYET